MKILIVEDNADDRRMLRMNLEHHGCEVIDAGDGEEGFELAKKYKPDLIISDALMPKMDGFQFLRVLKSDGKLKDIPFIFYSAVYTGYKEAELAISLGAEEFIIKPKEPEELWNELNSIVEECRYKKEKPITAKIIEEEEAFLRKYSHVVATKLEEKVRELENEIAKRKETEKEMRYLASIIQAIPEAVVSITKAGDITSWNSGAEKMLGHKAEEIIGKHISLIIPKDIVQQELQHCFTLLDTEGCFSGYETTRISKEKKSIPVELSAVALKDEKQNITSYAAVMRDITERKNAEKEIKERMDELQRFYEMAVTRELKMKELKEEKAKLKAELAKYKKD